MDKFKIAKELFNMAKRIADEDEEEKEIEEEIEETKEEEDLIEMYKDGDVSDVIDKLARMKSLKAIHSALQIYDSLSDDAAKTSFMRVIKRRIKNK